MLDRLGGNRGLALHLRAGRLFTFPPVKLGPDHSQIVQDGLLPLVIPRADRPGALERHMFVQMRQAGLADLLIHTADSERHVDADDRGLMPFHHQDGHPVGKLVLDDPVGQARGPGLTRHGCRKQSGQDKRTHCSRPCDAHHMKSSISSSGRSINQSGSQAAIF